jgi:hypothetical protein
MNANSRPSHSVDIVHSLKPSSPSEIPEKYLRYRAPPVERNRHPVEPSHLASPWSVIAETISLATKRVADNEILRGRQLASFQGRLVE